MTVLSGALLIQGGRVIDPANHLDHEKDLLIKDGKILAIDNPGSIPVAPGSEFLKLSGQWILPGFIDVHVHLREPGLEYKETIATGTAAAVAGGFTSVACMANTQPVNDSAYVTTFIRERAKETAVCRVFPIGAVTKGLKGEELAEIGSMIAAGACALSDDGMPVMNSYLMRKALDYAKAFDVAVISHAEDANLVGQGVMNEGALSNALGLRGNPAAAEEIMVAREIALCRLTKARVHIAHVSTALAVELIKRAKEEGLPLTAEVCPHHLVLDETCLQTYDTNCKMAPPLRTAKDTECLVAALASGVIDMIATDHAPHGVVDKCVEFDRASNGILGLQTAVPLTYELVARGLISRNRWIDSLTASPAKLINHPELGSVRVGGGADLTIFDSKASWLYDQRQNVSKSSNSPFFGFKLNSKIGATIVGGKLVYQNS